MPDNASQLLAVVKDTLETRSSVRIVGTGSKSFLYAGDLSIPLLDTSEHSGVVEYRPEELVITVRAGTPLAELRQTIATHKQMWACDPPEFGGQGTVGGAIASGLCGPGRPWYGSMRDSLLGVELINGFGEYCRFGGKVIKNVAGFDVARLLAGSAGTLGIILSASLKLVPMPAAVRSIAVPCNSDDAESLVSNFFTKTSTLSGNCFHDGTLYLRFSGVAGAVNEDLKSFSSRTETDPKFWCELRDHHLPFFLREEPLWRISLPIGTWYHEEVPDHTTTFLSEWNGSLLWCRTQTSLSPQLSQQPNAVRSFRNLKHETPLPSKYSARLKHAFDPQKIFNPGVVI